MMDIQQEQAYATPQARWEAVINREPGADGAFFYAVKTTGVYCRPGCASRVPNRENVLFFDTPQAAEAAGYRSCKRCRPNQAEAQQENTERILRACAMLEQAEECPTLQSLAEAAGLSPFYFQRLFRKVVGVTPRQYFAQKRSERVRANLKDGGSVTQALYSAGYGSSAQFYSQAGEILGMKPAAYQNGGRGARIAYTVQPCYLGWVLIAATQVGICAITFGDSPQELEKSLKEQFPGAEHSNDDPQFSAWVQETLAFLDTPQHSFNLPLDIQGTAFQQRVWRALREIPSGSQASYAEIASRIGQPKAARAVAQACAANHIAVAIPCHRVVRGNGNLGGYRWGKERKRKLLDRESI